MQLLSPFCLLGARSRLFRIAEYHDHRKKRPRYFIPARNCLFNALAAALDQDDQHDYREDTSHYTNHRYIVHVSSPFSMNEIFIETFHYGDDRRTKSHEKERRKNKEDKRED